MVEGRTSLIIAHRLSTVQRADKIIVTHKGQVREIGTTRCYSPSAASTSSSINCNTKDQELNVTRAPSPANGAGELAQPEVTARGDD